MRILILHQAVAEDVGADEQDVLDQRDAVAAALRTLGHQVFSRPVDLNLAGLERDLLSERPDMVFNLVESLAGSARLLAAVPALLDAFGIRYTGASTESLFISTYKPLAKNRLAQAGLRTPAWWAQGPSEGLRFPNRMIIKSAWERATIGLDDQSVVQVASGPELAAQIEDRSRRLGTRCFAEAYVEGREINVGLLMTPEGLKVLPIAEILFVDYPSDKPRIVSYDSKWNPDSFDYGHTPRNFELSDMAEATRQELVAMAKSAWSASGLSGWGRVDFRVDKDGVPWVLEVNSNPCLSPDAGFAVMLQEAGISYESAISGILLDPPVPILAQPLRPAPVLSAKTPRPVQFRTEVTPGDRELVRQLVASSGYFSREEEDISVELVDEYLQKGPKSGYHFIFAEDNDQTLGYSCFGPTPGTASAHDLYWIAVSQAARGLGIGQQLQEATERAIRAQGGTRVYAETSSRAQYGSTQKFYLAAGYREAAHLPDFMVPATVN